MKPANLPTKIFLDSGDPNETKESLKLLGDIDGQTTNPSLVAKNLKAQNPSKSFSKEELNEKYKEIVTEISNLIPNGSVSIEVYAKNTTPTEELVKQAQEFFTWIPNAHIKLPITNGGLSAAEQLSKNGIRLNMTLCFSQEQAAAVHAATSGSKIGDIYVSPFVGRLDDKGIYGLDLISNIKKMYDQQNSHVQVLMASARNLGHLLSALYLKVDIITVPFKVLKEWAEAGFLVPSDSYSPTNQNLQPIEFAEITLGQDFRKYNISHPLTDAGLQKFAADWEALILK